MSTQVISWLSAHGVQLGVIGSFVMGVVLRHAMPKVKAWITTTAVDVAVMDGLVELNSLLKRAGASEDEIKSVNLTVSQIALRASQDMQKATTTAPAPK